MGVEAFGISIKFLECRIYTQLQQALKIYPQVHCLHNETTAAYNIFTAEYEDGKHFIDFQILHEIATHKCSLTMRFSLCSHDSIDSIFIEITNEILSLFEGHVSLMTSALKYKSDYFPGDQKWLLAALPDEIIEMRKYWQNLFGTKRGAVRVKESFLFVGLPNQQSSAMLPKTKAE
jgi:hypothetical protein